MKGHGNWRKRSKEWGPQFGVVILAMLWLALIANSWAAGREGSPPSAFETERGDRSLASYFNSKPDEEYNFDWLDPEKKIYVLQNRRYLKAKRFLYSVMVGPGLSNSYRNTFNLDPRIAFYPTEICAIEVFYSFTWNTSNNTYKALVNTGTNVIPVIREIRSQYGILAHWIPWYAKINVFNKILYFDWYLSGGVGNVHTALDTNTTRGNPSNFVNQDFLGLFVGTGHLYHLSQDITVRLDFSGAFYNAPIFGNSGDNTWFSNYNFGIGLGFSL